MRFDNTEPTFPSRRSDNPNPWAGGTKVSNGSNRSYGTITRQMSDAEIDKVIIEAFRKRLPILVQLKSTNTAGLNEQIVGFLLGDYDEDGFSLHSGYIWWNQIRHVEITDLSNVAMIAEEVDPFE